MFKNNNHDQISSAHTQPTQLRLISLENKKLRIEMLITKKSFYKI